ncbi:MAG TPA: DNA/RNA non-specific endonuclease [Bacteroidales bacterium]|nr:DNA/RNA non-specific endonuclease [Bacteroidales bacterium]
MKIKGVLLIIAALFVFANLPLYSQSIEKELEELNEEINILNRRRDSIQEIVELLKLDQLKSQLIEKGIPKLKDGEELICHSAFCLVYDEEHEMAKWTAHIISHEIATGGINRTNDFRIDSLIKTGSSEEADFFLQEEQFDGTIKYEGFGYDRGHLAPSADFRWSAIALSESYFYSNMTPQLPDFNRELWADIESFAREYVYNNPGIDIFVVTAPVLTDDLPKQEKSLNKISIPEYHYKILVDFQNKKGIAFLVSQKNLDYPIESYVVSIDSVEKITGINYYPTLTNDEEKLIESSADISLWRTGTKKNDVAPLKKSDLPKDCYNTVEAKQFYDYPQDVTICGTVVSTHKSKKGHIFINLDKGFPHQIFTATIWKSNVINFSYEPEKFLLNKKVCIKGKVKDYEGTPSTYPENEKAIKVLE